MLTAADCDRRPDPGPAYPLHVRVLWRLDPGCFVPADLPQLHDYPEDLHAAQAIAGCLTVLPSR